MACAQRDWEAGGLGGRQSSAWHVPVRLAGKAVTCFSKAGRRQSGGMCQ